MTIVALLINFLMFCDFKNNSGIKTIHKAGQVWAESELAGKTQEIEILARELVTKASNAQKIPI